MGLGLQLDNISDELRSSRSESIRQQIARIGRQIKGDVAEARQIIWNLRQPHLEDQDLVSTLVEHARALATGTSIQVQAKVTGEVQPCAPPVLHQILRITREAVTNAVRHARPSRICIDVSYRSAWITVKVIDDGSGFSAESSSDSAESHWGLTFMRERAETVGGSLAIASLPGRGTTIEATLPLKGLSARAMAAASSG